MGYSKNPAILETRLPLLEELASGRACSWQVSPPSPLSTQRKAFELREALYIASLHPTEYPLLARAHQAFSIHVIRPGLIEAKPRQTPTELRLTSDIQVPTHGLGPFGRPVSTVGKTTAKEIIDAWLSHTPSLDAVHFQQTTLPIDELRTLYHWATEHRPKLMLLVGDGFLTVSLLDAEVASYAWTPPPEPKPAEPPLDL